MQLNRFRIIILISVLGIGCSPSEPCENGDCCGLGKVKFVRQVTGARVEYGGLVFAFQDVVSEAPNYSQGSAFICNTQKDFIKAMNLKTNTAIDSQGKVRWIDSTHTYPYRVWGTLYNLIEMPGFAGPNYSIRIDKVESVNE